MVIISLIFSVVLFLIGLSSVFDTQKTIARFNSLAKDEEGEKLFNTMSSESTVFWTKVCGICIIIFAVMLFIGMIILLINKQSL
jgi:hypothetical protein